MQKRLTSPIVVVRSTSKLNNLQLIFIGLIISNMYWIKNGQVINYLIKISHTF